MNANMNWPSCVLKLNPKSTKQKKNRIKLHKILRPRSKRSTDLVENHCNRVIRYVNMILVLIMCR